MVTVTLQTFLCMYFAHGISHSSASLSTALYSSHWYKLLPDLGKPLIILMERLQRKCELMAGKVFHLNLPMFATVGLWFISFFIDFLWLLLSDYGSDVSSLLVSTKFLIGLCVKMTKQ